MPSRIFRIRRKQTDAAFFREDLRHGRVERKMDVLRQGCYPLEDLLTEDNSIPLSIAMRVWTSAPIERGVYLDANRNPNIDLSWPGSGFRVNLRPLKHHKYSMEHDEKMQRGHPLWVFGPILGCSVPILTAYAIGTSSALYTKSRIYQLSKSPNNFL